LKDLPVSILRLSAPVLLIALFFCLPVAAADPARPPAEVAAVIDRVIDARLAKEKVPASGQADDAEFLRRAYLDLIGRIPTGERAAEFLASRAPDKRVRLVDELLSSHEYGRHFAELWNRRIGPRSDFVGQHIEKSVFPWLAAEFNRNRPWSGMVADMLQAEGEPDRVPASGFYLSDLNTIEGIVQADRVTASVAQLFLGVNLRCAQCHDHPFAKWRRTEFWEMAVFFGRIGYTSKATTFKYLTEGPVVLTKDAQPIPTARPEADIEIPGKRKVVKARFLEGETPSLDPTKPFRTVLAAWLTARDNKRFAAAAVNRMWNHLMGRGLVVPVDDMHDDNPPSHPEVLDELSRQFAASGHDLHYLIRCITLSRAYGRTSRPTADNRTDSELYSHQILKQMTPEMLYDSIALVTDGRTIPADVLASVRNPGRDHWINVFGSLDIGEDQTRYTHGVPQALRMLNSGLTNANPPVVRRLLKDKFPWEKGLEEIYLAVLARRPSPEEVKLFAAHRARQPNIEVFYRQSLWALVNSSEFLFNH
jgi:hypothetical protein